MFKVLKDNIKKHFNNYKLIFYYLLAFIAFLILCWFIYIRFIMEHVLRNIPFILTEFWFYLLIVLCLNYLYSIKVTIKPPKSNIIIIKLLSYLSYIAMSFLILDQLMKTNRYLYHYTIRSIRSIKYLIPLSHGKGQRILLITLSIIPRIILVIIFISDVFWFHCLNNFYHFLFLGLIPLLYQYHKFSMHQNKEIALQHLETLYVYIDLYELGWNTFSIDNEQDVFEGLDGISTKNKWQPHPRNKYHAQYVSIRKYVELILAKNIDEIENNYDIEGGDYYEYECHTIPEVSIVEQYKIIYNKTELEKEDYDILQKEFNAIMPYINELTLYLHYLPQKEKGNNISTINLIIYGLYLIGWGYIFIKSIHTLNDLPMTLEILKGTTEYLRELNPFINP